MLAQANHLPVPTHYQHLPLPMVVEVLLAELRPSGPEKSLDGTGQLCRSVPVMETLIDTLLLVATVHSLK